MYLSNVKIMLKYILWFGGLFFTLIFTASNNNKLIYIMSTLIQDIKQGDYFKRKEGAKKTFERGVYCRTNKAYECTNVDDISDFIYIKKNKSVILTDY